MKISMKVLLLSLAMIFVGLSANAQKWIEEKAQAETNKVAAALDLDNKMKAQIHEIHVNTYKKQREVTVKYKEKEGDHKAAKKAAIKAIWVENTAAVKNVIGKDLAVKYTAFKKSQKKKGKQAKSKKKPKPKKKPQVKKEEKAKKKPKAKNKLGKKAAKFEKELANTLDWDEASLAKVNAINSKAYEALQDISDEVRDKKKAGKEVDMKVIKERRKAVWKKANEEIKAAVGKDKFKEYRNARKKIMKVNKK